MLEVLELEKLTSTANQVAKTVISKMDTSRTINKPEVVLHHVSALVDTKFQQLCLSFW
jgi:hypothetical protein